MANLFDKAKTKAKSAPVKKDEKVSIKVVGKEFDDNLKMLAELREKIEQLEAQKAVAESVVKETAIRKFDEIYLKNKVNPGSFNVLSESASVMVIPNDKYIKIDESRFNELKDTYSDDVVTEKTEFVLNAELLEKYGEVLSDLIQNSDKISDDDKDTLISARTSYSVSKGSIDKAFTVGKGEVVDFIRDINPIFNLKNPKLNS
jgi:hypothetical protein